MRLHRWRWTAASLVVVGCGAFAQVPKAAETSGPAAEAQRAYAAVKANLRKAAERMPAEDYGYKPTPEVRTFARVVQHVAESQQRSCSAANRAAGGDAIARTPPAGDSRMERAPILAALQASFVACDQAYAGLTDANLTELLDTSQSGKRSRIGVLWGNIAHDNEQYATLALYLRLKGLAPPSSEK